MKHLIFVLLISISTGIFGQTSKANALYKFVPELEERSDIVSNIIVAAEYPAGNHELITLIAKQINLKEECSAPMLSKTYLRFTVEATGKVSAIQVKVHKDTPKCVELENQLKKIVGTIGIWKPASNASGSVASYVTLPLNISYK